MSRSSSSIQSSFQVIPPLSIHSPFLSSLLGLNPSLFTLNGTNIYLLGNSEERVIIDCGEKYRSPKVIENLRSYIKNTSIKRISAIFISHHHHDHTGGIANMMNFIQEFHGNKEEIPVYKYKSNILRGAVPSSLVYSEIVNEEFSFTIKGNVSKGVTDDTMKYDLTIRPLFVPGHSEDSCAFAVKFSHTKKESEENDKNLNANENDSLVKGGEGKMNSNTPIISNLTQSMKSTHISKSLSSSFSSVSLPPPPPSSILFVGDCILGEGTSVYDDLPSYSSSLTILLNHCNSQQISTLYPGHGPPLTNPSSAIQDYMDFLEYKTFRIKKLIGDVGANGMSLDECYRKMYSGGGGLPRDLEVAAKNVMRLHFKELIKEKEIVNKKEKHMNIHHHPINESKESSNIYKETTATSSSSPTHSSHVSVSDANVSCCPEKKIYNIDLPIHDSKDFYILNNN